MELYQLVRSYDSLSVYIEKLKTVSIPSIKIDYFCTIYEMLYIVEEQIVKQNLS